MNVMIWLTVGSVMVWLTLLSMSAGVWRALQQNIVVGTAGAILGGYLLSPFIADEVVDSDFVIVTALVMAAVGALSLLTAVKWLTAR